MFDPNGEVAARTPAVEMVTREKVEKLRDCGERFFKEGIASELPHSLAISLCETILALYADNERLLKALEECEPHVFREELWGQVNAALRQHKEVFGNE